MSWKRQVTIGVMLVATAAIVLWDIWVAINSSGIGERGQTTVSGITLGWAGAHPALPFSLGGLVGHLLWPVRSASRRLLRVCVLAGAVMSWLIVDIWVAFSLHAMLVFAPGVALGHLLWPQIEDPPKTEP